MHSTIHIELYVCILLLVIMNCWCLFYMNHNINIYCNCMNFDEYKQHIWQANKYFSFVLEYSKRTCPVIVGCKNKPFYYKSTVFATCVNMMLLNYSNPIAISLNDSS